MNTTGASRRARALTLAMLIAALPACGSTSGEAPSTVLVSAAASLTDAFGELESEFEGANPDIDVVLNLAGSSTLREQILEGAPADVFASANLTNMEQLVAAGEVAGDPQAFAGNSLQIAVPPGNPAGVTGLGDFEEDSLLVGLCAVAVPCGEFARQALAKAGVRPVIDTNEPDVRALLTKIELGELDAGITYVTDVASADGAVDGIEIAESHNVIAEYPIAILAGAPNPDAAAEFVDYVLSDHGQAVLADHGFVAP